MTNQDLRRLEEFANRKRPQDEPALNPEAAKLAQETVRQLDQSVSLVEDCLKELGVLFKEVTLPAALIGAIGFSTLEIRRQLPALREAAKGGR